MVETIINDNLQFYCSFSSGMKEMIVIWKKKPVHHMQAKGDVKSECK